MPIKIRGALAAAAEASRAKAAVAKQRLLLAEEARRADREAERRGRRNGALRATVEAAEEPESSSPQVQI